MPTKKTTKSDAPAAKKAPKANPSTSSGSAKAAPKAVKAVSVEKAEKKPGDLKSLRGELYTLKIKHAMRELKEVHKIKQARQAVARFLTALNSK